MLIEEAIDYAIEGKSILFVGAGFSVGASNLNGNDFKVGTSLSKYLADLCNITDNLRVEDAAEFYIDMHGKDRLISELEKEFKAKEISDSHRIIAKVNWKRIYTTNYDNIVELAYSSNSKNIKPVTLNDDIRSIPKNKDLCIHINGFIDRLDRNTLGSEFKLTDTSYSSSNFANSPWSQQFRNDIKLAESVFFIGYSLYDLDIKRVLFEDEQLKKKCFFVVGKDPREVVKLKLTKFGNLISEDCDSFSIVLESRIKNFIPHMKTEIVHIALDKFTPPEFIEPIHDKAIFDLFLWGTINTDYIWQTVQTECKDTYYLGRDELEQFVEFLSNKAKNVVVHSDLGNGKSLFIEGVKCKANFLGYNVYTLKENGDQALKELEQLFKLDEKTLIIIEQYNNHFKTIDFISRMRTDRTVLVLTARSLIHDVVSERLYDTIDDPSLKEIELNRVTDREIEWFFDLFTEFGLWGNDAKLGRSRKLDILKRVCDQEIHAILLRILNSPKIIEKFTELINVIDNNPKIYTIVISIFILTVLDYEVTTELLTDLLSSDMLRDIAFRRDDTVAQLVDFEKGRLKARSSIAAQFVLTNLRDSEIIISTMVRLAKSTDKLTYNKDVYWKLMRDLMRFGQLQFILPKKKRRPSIIRYYESIKNLRSCKNNQFFWFQYAIACMVIEEYEMADRFFSTSYSLAGKLDNFDTYQIDNQYARFLLETAIKEEGIDYMKNFKKARNLLNKQIQRENRFYPYRIAILYYDFYEKFSGILKEEDLSIIFKSCKYIISKIDKLTSYRRTQRYVEECKLKLSLIMEQTKPEKVV